MALVDGESAVPIPGLMPVELGDVEDRLAARLDRVNAQAGISTVSRACALNLIVHVGDLPEAPAVAELIHALSHAHPMRVIGTTLNPHRPAGRVSAWIDAECGDATDGAALCSELIALSGSPDDADRMTSVIESLLSPELPVAFWWRSGSPFLSRLFKGVAQLADKIVVDSKRFGDGPSALDTLHRLNQMRGGRLALSDMNWHRIATWRLSLSACFDDPAVMALLPEFDRSSIEFSTGPAGPAGGVPSSRSLLLASWLVSRLPSVAGHGEIRGTTNAWATQGAVVGLALRSSASKASVSIVWESAEAGICATAFDRAGAPIRRWRFSPDPEGEADLLYRCIESVTQDVVLEAALRAG